MRLEPINDQVVIRITSRGETTTESGIVLKQDAAQAPDMGVVVAVGPGRMENSVNGVVRLPMQVDAGEQVLVSKRAGYPVRVGEDEFVVVRENEIIAVLHET